MMRIAKIADELAGVGAGGLEGGAASATAGDESERRRGPGGSLRGRGGVGRGTPEIALIAPESSGARAGSEAGRGLSAPTSGNDGFERRRMGGG